MSEPSRELTDGGPPRPARQPASTAFKVGVAVVVVAGLLIVGWQMKRTSEAQRPPALSSDERRLLETRDTLDGKRLVHPVLGFSLAHPGEMFFAADDSVREMEGQFDDASTQFYAYGETNSGRLLFITVSKRPGIDADGFEEMVDKVAKLFAQKTVTRLGDHVSVEQRTHEIDGIEGRATIHEVLANGAAHIRLGAWRSRFGRDTEYVVMLIGVSMKGDLLGDVISSFRLRGG
jgi:hypothetical protein